MPATKKGGGRTFEARLKEELKSKRAKERFEQYKIALDIAIKMVELRKRLNLSQVQLAKLMGTSQQAISRIESGDYEGFTLRTLTNFAKATNTELEIRFKEKKLKKAS